MQLQMRSDVPVGAYLSGGIDSSLVSALASKQYDKSLPMFHGKFSEGPEYDESFYAKELVKFSKGTYFEIIPTAQDFVDLLPALIFSLDEPLAGPGVFPQFATSKLAAQHVKVVLGGQGGDEIFGAYGQWSLLERTFFNITNSPLQFKLLYFDRKYFFTDELKNKLLLDGNTKYERTTDFLFRKINELI